LKLTVGSERGPNSDSLFGTVLSRNGTFRSSLAYFSWLDERIRGKKAGIPLAPIVTMPKKILVVDDDAVSLKNVSLVLQEKGYQIEQAHDGNQALQKLKSETFDLVLSDIVMPGVDGLMLSERVRSDFPPTAVILMTGNLPDVASACVEDKHLVLKPFSFEKLLQKISDVLDSKNPF
jgi:CheY-like chemotaxis protein